MTRYSLTGISSPATPTRDGNGDRGDSLMVAALAVSSCSTVQLPRASVYVKVRRLSGQIHLSRTG